MTVAVEMGSGNCNCRKWVVATVAVEKGDRCVLLSERVNSECSCKKGEVMPAAVEKGESQPRSRKGEW